MALSGRIGQVDEPLEEFVGIGPMGGGVLLRIKATEQKKGRRALTSATRSSRNPVCVGGSGGQRQEPGSTGAE